MKNNTDFAINKKICEKYQEYSSHKYSSAKMFKRLSPRLIAATDDKKTGAFLHKELV